MIDFYASRENYVDHLAPVWHALPIEHRGTFFCTYTVEERIRSLGIAPVLRVPRSDNPCVVAGWPDEIYIKSGTPIYLDHGAGQTYSADDITKDNPSFPGGKRHERASLFLCPREEVANLWRAAYPSTPAVAIGCPKLDYFPPSDLTQARTVAISFHHNVPLIPELEWAFPWWRDAIASAASTIHFIGHGHPRAWPHLEPFWIKHNIPLAPIFGDVLARAAMYLVDNSSTALEFAATGKPVILLNAPQYRRDVDHGNRFWEWTESILTLDDPWELESAITATLAMDSRKKARMDLVEHVYGPLDGKASERAVAAILDRVRELGKL